MKEAMFKVRTPSMVRARDTATYKAGKEMGQYFVFVKSMMMRSMDSAWTL